jgi:cytochrome c peroxidase
VPRPHGAWQSMRASIISSAMTLFTAWASLNAEDAGFDPTNDARRGVAAGEALFNTAPIRITNVRGLNDNPALGKPDSFIGHCTSCHDTPNVGNHSLPLPLDIGTSHTLLPSMASDPAIAASLELSMPDLPVYLINGCPNPFTPGEPESFYTSDPGKALIPGKCADFNRTKGPILRGLAARAPYFHNGAAAKLQELVNFYNACSGMQLSDEQKADLVAFLNSR